MNDLIEKLKEHVTTMSAREEFVHHEWFVEYHLKIAETIALELCEKYLESDKDLVLVLIWIHDYGKILDKSHEHDELMFEKCKLLLSEIGFDPVFIQKAIDYLILFEKKMEIDLNHAPIEVRIASSSDAASHLVGPFWALYFKENNEKSLKELMSSNIEKLNKDWERKVVLPEIKQAFLQRHLFVQEQSGIFPKSFL